MTEHFTKSPGQYVPMNETVDSVIRIVNGEYIKQSPEIFAFVGSALNIKTDKELGLIRTQLGDKIYEKRLQIKKLSSFNHFHHFQLFQHLQLFPLLVSL